MHFGEAGVAVAIALVALAGVALVRDSDHRQTVRSVEQLLDGSQRKDGPFCFYRGSWDPSDPWGADGGRVYSTAIVAMSLNEAFGPGR